MAVAMLADKSARASIAPQRPSYRLAGSACRPWAEGLPARPTRSGRPRGVSADATMGGASGGLRARIRDGRLAGCVTSRPPVEGGRSGVQVLWRPHLVVEGPEPEPKSRVEEAQGVPIGAAVHTDDNANLALLSQRQNPREALRPPADELGWQGRPVAYPSYGGPTGTRSATPRTTSRGSHEEILPPRAVADGRHRDIDQVWSGAVLLALGGLCIATTCLGS